MHYFDYESVAQEAHIPADKLTKICELVRKDYPDDDNLYELHVLRACMSVRDGLTTLDKILKVAVPAKA